MTPESKYDEGTFLIVEFDLTPLVISQWRRQFESGDEFDSPKWAHRCQVLMDALDTAEKRQAQRDQAIIAATWEAFQSAAIEELDENNWEWKQHGIPHVLRNNLPCPTPAEIEAELARLGDGDKES